MSINYLEVDETLLPELVQTERLKTPVELLTLEEYLHELRYMPTEELPEMGAVGAVIVEKMNQHYSKVMMGGKFRIADNSTGELYFYEKGAFKDYNADLIAYGIIKGERKQASVVDLFMKSAEAKKFAEVTFNPAHIGDYGRVKNLFVGFPQTPVKGETIALSEITEEFDYEIFHAQIKESYPACVRLIEHLHDNVADGNVLAFAQLLAWCSEIITQPEINPGFCVILRGTERGTGKTTISDVMREVLGERYHFKASKSEQIIGRFNSHMKDKLLIVGEEMSWGGNRDLSAQLKDMITGNSHAVELKGVDIQQMPKYFRMMLVTNEDWVFNAAKDERRALIFDVNPQQAQNKPYFEPLYASERKLKPELIEQFRNMLASIDTTGIDMMKPVQTDGLRSQIAESLNPMEQWWLSVIDNGDFGDEDPFNCSTKLEGRISKAFIHKHYLDWLDKHKPNSSERITGARAFGVRFVRMVGKQFVRTDQKVRLSNLKMVNAYDFHRPKEMIEKNKKAFGM